MKKIINDNGIKYYKLQKFQQIQTNNYDFFKITFKDGDRLDLIASKYFGKSSLWRIILKVNNLYGDSIYLQPGTELYIPKDYLKYV